MRLRLPKLLLTAVGAAICCVHQAEADTYYLNVADSNGTTLSSGVANTSGGSNIDGGWKELCSLSDSYHGPHKLVIDQARTATNYIKLDFNPLTVASFEVAEAASGTWISNTGTREYHIGSTDASQTSVFHGDLKLQGTGTKLVADQTWDIDEGVTVTLTTGTVTTVPGAAWTLSGKGKLDASAATVINLGDTVYNSADTTIDFGSATVKIETYDILKGCFEQSGVSIGEGGVEGNGYITAASDIKLFSNIDKVAFGKVQLDGNDVASNNGVISGESIVALNASSYFIYNDEEYGSAMDNATSLHIMDDATLTLNKKLAASVTGGITINGANATFDLGSDAELQSSSVHLIGVENYKLTGKGVYNMGNINSVSLGNAILADTWSGIVAVKQGGRGINLANWDVYKTKIQFEGFTGYLSDATLSKDLILVNSAGENGYALRLDNGSSTSNTTATFSGAISGSGNIEYTWDIGNTYKTTHVISGDTSEWDGKFLRKLIDSTNVDGITEGKNVDVKFTKGGNVFKANGNGGVADADGTNKKMNVIIEAASATTFNGSIENVNAVTVNSDTTFKQQVGAQSLTLAAGKNMGVDAAISTTSLTLGENAGLVFGGGKLSVVDALALDSTIITLAQGMEFATAEDYELLTVTGAGNTLSVNGWENWVGNTYNIGGVDYTTGLNLANNTLSVRFTAMPIPEPATATLSLLALAAMAARRRRK
ncbi:MAG: hypothetical protein E7033_03960 [Akkermansiaceae bacterium]|nr:hypothetical protein [Akkermansiaceae bacterium]